LSQPKDAIYYFLSRALKEAHPDRFLLETSVYAFDVPRFSHGNCELRLVTGVHSQLDIRHSEQHDNCWAEPVNTWCEIEWEGRTMDLITLGLQGDHCRETRHFLLAPDEATGTSFFLRVCQWNTEIRGEVLVFSGGWHKDSDLFEAIQTTTLEGLVLEHGLKEHLTQDFEAFFASEEEYTRYGIPWKRGVLLLGPPGNGKTHAIKGLVNRLQVPALYVKSFKHSYTTDHEMMRTVFAKARTTAPCLLILEDLDALLDDGNRAFFLNEMDGFASNRGMMVVASTNHPERLDPAILQRPSRFDRKYTFHLPELDGRTRYLALCNETLEEELRLSPADVACLAEATGGFSYAYLKELFLSAMMDWIRSKGERPMVEVMLSQVETLLQQMVTEPEAVPPDDEDDLLSDLDGGMRRWRPRS
jgi:hypothetical protein